MQNLFVRDSLLGLGGDIDNLSRSWLLVLNNILHEGESENLLDAVVVGQEHDQAVDTHTPTTGRWEAVLKRLAEGLINELSLVVTLALLVCLLFL